MKSLVPTTLKESLYATVAYFDLFDYPLTPQELWTFLLYPPCENVTLEAALDASCHMEELEWTDGFVHLMGREHHIQTRIDRYLIAERKYRKALAFSRICSLIPGVSVVAACNTLAFSHSRDESDIDLVIVARKGYVWFVRAASIMISLAFGQRPSEYHMRDALCLSFFISDDALDLSMLSLSPFQGVEDVYLAVWVSRCVPLYAEQGCFEAFWNANAWSERMLPNRQRYLPNRMRRVELWPLAHAVKRFLTFVLLPLQRVIEHACKAFQCNKFPSDIRSKAAQEGTDVVINDAMLKFHLADRRSDIRDAFCGRLQSYRSRLL